MDTIENKKDIAPVDIKKYNPQFKWEFERLNRQWLEKYFIVESIDLEVFSDPVAKIIRPGGEIIFALVENQVAGTCALIKEGKDRYQLGRMAVDEKFQGYGIGKKLMEEILGIAQNKKAKTVYLHSNTRLRPALRLYEKYGFKTTHLGQHPKFIRGNIIMEKDMDKKSHE